MTDVRSLLRQQRAARKITHPNAAYSEAGKLLCTLCHEPLKNDSLWDGHIRSSGHRQRATAQSQAKNPNAKDKQQKSTDQPGGSGSSSTDTPSDAALLAQIIGGRTTAAAAGQKRKHGDDESDEDMGEADEQTAVAEDAEEAIRHKRSKQDIGSPSKIPSSSMSVSISVANGTKDAAGKKTPPTVITPPGLVRRASGTPSHGVEIQMPSRPATPGNANGSASSTPKGPPMGRSPLIPREAQTGVPPPTSNPGSKAAFVATAGPASFTTTAAAAGRDDDDDAVWAAFEAEVVNVVPSTTITSGPGYSADAVIAAAPLTAEQLAAKSEEEERAKRRAAADIQIEDEKEEATRALEAEFEEMEVLEARVRKLKEKREALRRASVSAVVATASNTVPISAVAIPDEPTKRVVDGKENVNGSEADNDEEDEDNDDEDEDEDDEDDWVGFRFRN